MDQALSNALILADDYQPEERMKGISCLQEIVTVWTSTELRWYSRCDVIYDCLFKMLYLNEESLFEPLYSTYLSLLKKCYYQADAMEYSKTDAVFQRLIETATLEQKTSSRELLSKFLVSYIDLLKTRAIVWRFELFRIFQEYLEDSRDSAVPQYRNTLKAMLEFCRFCYPRLNTFLEEIMEMTVKFVYEQFRLKSKIDCTCSESVKAIWELVSKQDPENFELVCEGLENLTSVNKGFVTFMSENLSRLKSS